MLRLILLFAALSFKIAGLSQYHFLGTAGNMQNGCIQLTPDMPFAEGIAFNTTKLDLNNFFEIEFDVYLGNKDEGADGITFVIHNDKRGFDAFGQWGECMGYGRFNPNQPGNSIDPSIAVELDTYQNIFQNDPNADHIAFLENGVNRHPEYWSNQNEAYNIEDDRLHDFRFRWNPDDIELTVLWDREVAYKGKRDLINDIFDKETRVIWGFTASTGRKYNLQYFCLKRITGLPSSEINITKGD